MLNIENILIKTGTVNLDLIVPSI